MTWPHTPTNSIGSVSIKPLRELSCLALNYKMYLAVNLNEKFPCKPEDKGCPEGGFFHFNTEVVFDRTGLIVARWVPYRTCVCVIFKKLLFLLLYFLFTGIASTICLGSTEITFPQQWSTRYLKRISACVSVCSSASIFSSTNPRCSWSRIWTSPTLSSRQHGSRRSPSLQVRLDNSGQLSLRCGVERLYTSR